MPVTYARAANVVWRLGPDRVMVRLVGGGDEGASDLFGSAAIAWVALDEPATPEELAGRVADADTVLDPGELTEAVESLVAAGLVVAG